MFLGNGEILLLMTRRGLPKARWGCSVAPIAPMKNDRHPIEQLWAK
jgi:hypothetical protein